MTLSVRVTALLAAPVAALFVPALWSYGTGAIPGEVGILGPVPTDVTRNLPGCGACHRPTPGGNNLNVDVALSARSLTPGQSITVTTSATGGRPHPMNWGGFCCDSDVGTFSAGPGTRVAANGRAVTHVTAFSSTNRTWTYGYTAPTTPGPIAIYANVNTVDGDGAATPGDLWAFHGADGLELQPTPVRLYVNVDNVLPVGDSCVGSFENHPVLGAQQPPDNGNANFAIELIGAAPNAPLVVLIGTPLPPVDLTPIGITGCTLHVNAVATLALATGPGNPRLSEGAAVVPLPIPAGISGTIRVQAAFVDTGNGRPLPLTVTNALDVNIQ